MKTYRVEMVIDVELDDDNDFVTEVVAKSADAGQLPENSKLIALRIVKEVNASN